MRTLLVVVAGLAALFCGYWYVAASQIEMRAEAALADLEAQGWDVAYTGIETSGFPTQFIATAEDVRLVAPGGRAAYQAPAIRASALSYQPNQVFLDLPAEQSVAFAGQEFLIASEDLRASASAALSADLPLDVVTLDGASLSASAEEGWEASLDGFRATIQRRIGGDAPSYDLTIVTEGLRSSAVGAGLDILSVEAQVTLDAPLDRNVQTPPRVVALTIREARLAQGEVAVAATAELAPDAQGYLSGSALLVVENWRGLLDLLEAQGLLILDQRSLVEGALEGLAQGADRIEVPVTFADGQIRALGVPLLEAPQVL